MSKNTTVSQKSRKMTYILTKCSDGHGKMRSKQKTTKKWRTHKVKICRTFALSWIRPLRRMWRIFSRHSESQLHINSPNRRMKKGNFVLWIFGILLYELCTQRFATWQRLTLNTPIGTWVAYKTFFLLMIFIHAWIFNADVKPKPSYANQKSSFGCSFFQHFLFLTLHSCNFGCCDETIVKSNAGKTDSLWWIPISRHHTFDTRPSLCLCALFLCVRLLVFIHFVNIWLMWQ